MYQVTLLKRLCTVERSTSVAIKFAKIFCCPYCPSCAGRGYSFAFEIFYFLFKQHFENVI